MIVIFCNLYWKKHIELHSFTHSFIHSLSLHSWHVPKRVWGMPTLYNEPCFQCLSRGKVHFSSWFTLASLLFLKNPAWSYLWVFALAKSAFSPWRSAYFTLSPLGLCETFLDQEIKKFPRLLNSCHVSINTPLPSPARFSL